MTPDNKTVQQIGFWSALLTTILAMIYIIPPLLIGINMPASKRSLLFILSPSMLLALSFLIMMTALHYQALDEKKIWSHIGLLFSLAYFVFVNLSKTSPYS